MVTTESGDTTFINIGVHTDVGQHDVVWMGGWDSVYLVDRKTKQETRVMLSDLPDLIQILTEIEAQDVAY